MARNGDTGPYELDNIKCITNAQNAHDGNAGIPKSEAHKTQMSKRVTTPDGEFKSLAIAGEYYGVAATTIYRRCKKTTGPYAEWYKSDYGC
jgi:hypothetical protein